MKFLEGKTAVSPAVTAASASPSRSVSLRPARASRLLGAVPRPWTLRSPRWVRHRWASSAI
jgi:hypothetical protein